MTRLTKQARVAMTESIMDDLKEIRTQVGETNAMAGVETFVAIALRLFAVTNPSKLRDIMRTVEIQARMDGKEVIG